MCKLFVFPLRVCDKRNFDHIIICFCVSLNRFCRHIPLYISRRNSDNFRAKNFLVLVGGSLVLGCCFHNAVGYIRCIYPVVPFPFIVQWSNYVHRSFCRMVWLSHRSFVWPITMSSLLVDCQHVKQEHSWPTVATCSCHIVVVTNNN